MSTATNWLFNFLIGLITPSLKDAISFRLYPLHALFCSISFVAVYLFYPETAGVELEDMAKVFGDDPDNPARSPRARQPMPQQEGHTHGENYALLQNRHG